jgi:hypothetical protein
VVRTLIVLALVLAAGTARAEPLVRPRGMRPETGPTLAVAGGATWPASSSRLGMGVAVGLDAAWRPELARGWLELVLAADAGQRTAAGHVEGDVAFDWRTVSHELWLVPAARLHLPLARAWSLGVGGGPALVWVQTVGGGRVADEPFADARESSLVPGVRAMLELEWRHEGGALVLDASYGVTRVSHRATGDATLDAIGLRAGYRWAF